MRVLALDTATQACSVAFDDGARCIFRFEELGRGHAQRILPMVDEVLTEANVALEQLDCIAVGVGPGTFTGVRIAVSVAQGLAFGARLPVVPVTSLGALALQSHCQSACGTARGTLVCLDARMGEVYWGCYVEHPQLGVVPLADLRVSSPAAVCVPPDAKFCGIGRGFDVYPQLAQLPGVQLNAQDSLALPHAKYIAILGTSAFRAGAGMDAAELRPVYLRDKVALTERERALR